MRPVTIVGLLLLLAFVAVPLASELAQSPGSPAPAPTSPRAIRARIRLIEQQASALRHLKPLHPVKVVFLKSPAFSKKIAEILSCGLTARDITTNYQEWVLSGMIQPSTNVRKVLTGGTATQVAGWYANKSKRLYIRDTGQALGIDRWYVAHEYTHALQDEHFDLARMQRDPEHHHIHNSDRYLAAHTLIEGDAVTIQNAYLQRYYSQADKVALFQQDQSLHSTPLPRTLQDSFDFPYTAGPTFVQYLLTRGSYAAVDQAFRHPPQTTYQVMYPSQPIHVTPVVLDGVGGRFRTWKTVDGDVNGALGSQLLVEQYVGGSAASTLSQLWRGDRYVLIHNGVRYAMLMESAFDGSSDTSSAASILEQSLATRFGGLRSLSSGDWGGKDGLYGAMRVSRDRIHLAFAHSATVARNLVVAPTT